MDCDMDYSVAIDRSMTIEAVLHLNPVFKREYLATLNTDALHDLEDALLLTQYEC